MSHQALAELAGEWKGSVQTWFEPTSEPLLAPSHGTLRPILNGRYMVFDYHWSMPDEPQEGSLMLGFHLDRECYVASWVDTFHTGTDIMHFVGEPRGRMSLATTYGPPDEPWGWRVELVLLGDTLVVGHFNIPPGEPEYLAVEFRLHRG